MGKRRREAWVKWRGLVSEQKRSGQSVAAFCREHGICAPQFFAWKKRLSEAGMEQFVAVQVVGEPSGTQPDA
jgi:transposase-like protein